MSGLSEADREDLYAAMRGWARDLCLDTETPVEVVERIVSAAVEQAEQRLASRFRSEIERALREADAPEDAMATDDDLLCYEGRAEAVEIFRDMLAAALDDGGTDA
jgi:hypothetical protein